jgi:hypothetical protein
MRLLRLQDVEIGPNDRVFHTTRACVDFVVAAVTATGHNYPVTQWNALASPQQLYFGRVFSLSRTRFNSSSFCPASPSLPSAVRRW